MDGSQEDHAAEMRGSHGQFDWERARRHVRALYRGRASGPDHEAVEDLVQECCIRTLRAMRRQAAEKPWALLQTVAQRTWVDHQRRSVRRRERLRALDDRDEISQPFDDPIDRELGELRERLVFMAHELFDRDGAFECQQLLRDYLGALDWQEVAQRLGRTHAATRKRWSRCLASLREAIARDPRLAPLLE